MINWILINSNIFIIMSDIDDLMQQINAMNITCRAVGGNVYAHKGANVNIVASSGIGGNLYTHKDANINIVGGVGGDVYVYDDKSIPDDVKQERTKEYEAARIQRENERQRENAHIQSENARQERERQRENAHIQREKQRLADNQNKKVNNDDEENEPFPSYISVSGYIAVPMNERKHSFDNLNGRFFEPFEINGSIYDLNRIISGLDDNRRTQILADKNDSRKISGHPRSVIINGVKITKKELDDELLHSLRSKMRDRGLNL